MLSPGEKKEKRNWFFFIVGYFAGGYLLINWINQFRTHYYDVSFSFEKSIPFIPALIFGYILVYFSMLLLYFLIDDIDDFRRAIIACLTVTTVHYIFFLALPVKYELRPDLTVATGFGVNVTRFYYIIDRPYNCFPSLHVAYPMIAALISWRHHRYSSGLFIVMAVIIAASVIFVKQHYIMDVAAGALTSIIVFKAVTLTEGWWLKLFRPSNASPGLSQSRSP
jgi:membrane-associated phospholipid phosphatase